MLTSRDTFVDAFDLSDDVRRLSRQRLRVPPPLPYAKVTEPTDDTAVTSLIAVTSTENDRRVKQRPLPAPPPAWPRPQVIAPRSPVGMLAHEMTRRIEDHLAAARTVVTLLDTEVVCLEDEPAARTPALVLPERPAPARPRAAGIRRSVILPWPAALMLLAIAGGVTFEHVHRGDLREVVARARDQIRHSLISESTGRPPGG